MRRKVFGESRSPTYLLRSMFIAALWGPEVPTQFLHIHNSLENFEGEASIIVLRHPSILVSVGHRAQTLAKREGFVYSF